MTHKTKGIVLRAIKYGETSLVVTIFTELFGVQTYMVNGIRTSKKSGSKAALYQPAALLELDVYHNELKKINRIKESNWSYIYSAVLIDVVRNSIALYMVELLYKSLKQPENNPDLFHFCEDAFQQLDKSQGPVAANFALYFTLHLPYFLGFRISNPDQEIKTDHLYIDLVEGTFTDHQPAHPHFISGENALLTAELLKVMQPLELEHIRMNHERRRELLLLYQDYYNVHISDFGQMKTLLVMHAVLS